MLSGDGETKKLLGNGATSVAVSLKERSENIFYFYFCFNAHPTLFGVEDAKKLLGNFATG